ncbi:MAG TPA: hypothetical protein VFY87_00490 [Geminicoccaceae bacterium]|nr:hypothetical protein [Geminicoccaceae bacterium]
MALLALSLSLGAATPISYALAEDFVGTVFTMTNTAIGSNQIVAYGRQEDGSLGLLYVVPIGGLARIIHEPAGCARRRRCGGDGFRGRGALFGVRRPRRPAS